MKEISEIKAFDTELSIVRLPESRIIGLEVENGGKLGNTAPKLWEKVYSTDAHFALEKLPWLVGKDLFGWTCEYNSQTNTFKYLVCALTPAGTPVPEGFVYRDIPETLCALGLFGEDVMQTAERAKKLGYVPNWDECGWNAEVYFHEEEVNPPIKCNMPWHWLVPIKSK